jgi:hypothetical protein
MLSFLSFPLKSWLEGKFIRIFIAQLAKNNKFSDWKKLPDIVASSFGGRASVVICTHL